VKAVITYRKCQVFQRDKKKERRWERSKKALNTRKAHIKDSHKMKRGENGVLVSGRGKTV
jgi:hypothetical protein